MGCRKRMLIYLLFYAFIPSHCAVINGRTVITVPLTYSTSEELSFPPTNLPSSVITSSTKRENLVSVRERLTKAVHAEPERHSVDVDNTRDGYERDLMVVLPVMQGNSDLTNSKLQILYTKPPVTAIIGEDSKDLRHQRGETISTIRAIERRIDTGAPVEEPNPNARRGPYTEYLFADKPSTNRVRTIERRVDSETSKEAPSDRHPYTEFLFSKSSTTKTNKSPLDYGYPESFKFVQELNELPKNHKPEWAITDAPETLEKAQTTKEGTTEDNPFQMYKSVIPFEINKLLAPKPLVVSVTDSAVEETVVPVATKKKQPPTEEPTRTKRPQQKRPTKKPQKSKPNPQKLNDDELFSLTSTTGSTTSSSTTTETPPTSTKGVESTSTFLPTPAGERVVAIVKEILANTTAAFTTVTTTTTPPTPSTPSTTLGLNLLWSRPETTTTELSPVKIVNEVKPSDLISLSRILGESFQPKIEPSTTHAPPPEELLNNDMRNLLLALGMIRSEMLPYAPFTTPKPTTVGNYLWSVFGKREPATPTVDPLSYVTFKKIPIEYERPRERTPVSDEMKNLLASFGLLPKQNYPFGNSIFNRMSRRRRLDGPSVVEENSTAVYDDSTDFENSTAVDNSTTTEMSAFNDTSTITFDEELELLSPSSNSSSESPLMNMNLDMLPDDMRSTLENLGLILPLPYNYQPSRHAHVFQPSVHLDRLGDRQKIEQINEAIDHIRRLSKSKDAYNLTVEEIEKQLENVTALLKDNSTAEDVTVKLDTSISNATASKVVETLQKIPIAEDSSIDNIDFNFTSDESSISVINVNSTDDDEESVTELNVVMNPPNPLSPEELQNLLETNKNDIKRQQPNDTSTPALTTEEATTIETPSTTPTSSSSSTSTESSTRAESNNAPISDLAASFGGGETASEEPSPLDAATERPNGLYFYLDWNTFLNVGEPDKNPVRIRFAPKAGNARNFLPITVP